MSPPNHLFPSNQVINLVVNLVRVEQKITKPTKTSFPSFLSSMWCHHKSVMSILKYVMSILSPGLINLGSPQFLTIQSIQSSPLVCMHPPLVPLPIRQFLSIQSFPLGCAQPPLVPLTTRRFLSIRTIVILSRSRPPSFSLHRLPAQIIRSLLSLNQNLHVSDAS